MYIKGDIDSNQKIVGNGLVLNVDAAQYRSFPRGGNIVTSGLVLNLDAGNPSSYSGTGTTWYDISGNGTNGTLVNGPTYNSANQGSIVFDGTNDYANLGNPLTFTNSFTINFWFKTTTAGTRVITGMYSGSGADWWIGVNGSNQLVFSFGSPSKIDIASSATVIDGVWRQATAVYNKSLNSTILYINGSQVASTTSIPSTVTQAGGNLMIATFGSNLGFYFPGNISTYSIYNRALSAAEVTQNYDALKYRYGVIGSTWFDLSGNANNGTLTNGPTLDFNNGGVIVFDGTNDYVTGSFSTSNVNEYTFDVWANVTVISVGGSPISTNGTGSQGSTAFIQMGGGSSPWQFNTIATDVPLTGVWYNVVGTQTMTTQTIYLNGVLKASGSGTSSLGTQYTVGTRYDRAAQSVYFNGKIAAAKIYNRALSATEVLNNFNAVKSRFGFTTTNIVTNGLILNIDASNTSSYPGSGANWFDISGYGNNGVLYNGPAFNSSNGGNISFDGADDYMDFGSYNFGNDFTICMWIKTPSSLKSNSNALLSNTAGGATQNGFRTFFNTFNTTNGSIYLETGNGSGGTGLSSINASVTVTVNGWNFITYTLSKTSSVGQIYKNGSFATSGAILNDFNTNGAFWFGRIFYSGYYVQANMANMRIYNRVLSGAEILQNYNADRATFGL